MFLVNQTVNMLEVVGPLMKHTVKMLAFFYDMHGPNAGISRVDSQNAGVLRICYDMHSQYAGISGIFL